MAENEGLDKILEQIGDFGKYQVLCYLSIFFIVIIYNAVHVAFVFTAMIPENRCFVPGCDHSKADFEAPHTKYSIPTDEKGRQKKCEMFASLNYTGEQNCSAKRFNQNETKRCDSFVFENEGTSIATEFNLLCEEDKWKLSLVGSINTIGLLFGAFLVGVLSDRFGRKIVLLLGISIGGLFGASKSLATSFEMFCILEFLESFLQAGSSKCVFVLAMEMATPKHRTRNSFFFFISATVGPLLLVVISWFIKYWRSLVYIIYTPCILSIFLYPVIIESVRWQLSKGEIEKPKKTLTKLAKSKGVLLEHSQLNELQRNLEQNEQNINISLFQVFKSNELLCRFLYCAVLWITNMFIYYGFSLNVVHLSGNNHLNFFLVAFSEIPANSLGYAFSEKTGRRLFLCCSYLSVVISMFVFILVGESGPKWLLVILYCLGKFGSTAALYNLLIITSEIFPTPLRNSSMALCSMVSRLGSMMSPQISLLGIIWHPLPQIVFGCAALIASLISLLLPETKGIKLPDNMKEAEEIGKKKILVVEEEENNQKLNC